MSRALRAPRPISSFSSFFFLLPRLPHLALPPLISSRCVFVVWRRSQHSLCCRRIHPPRCLSLRAQTYANKGNGDANFILFGLLPISHSTPRRRLPLLFSPHIRLTQSAVVLCESKARRGSKKEQMAHGRQEAQCARVSKVKARASREDETERSGEGDAR